MFFGTPCISNRLLGTIDGTVEFVHSVQLYSYVTSANSFMCPTKILIIVIIKCLSYIEITAILCSLFSVFTFFNLILENMSTNVRKFSFPCYI